MVRNDYFKLLRYARDTRTRCRHAAMWLSSFHKGSEHEEVRWMIGYESAALLRELQSASLNLAVLINDDDLEDHLRHARALHGLLRNRALVLKMSDATGRTPAEAAAFAAKASQLERMGAFPRDP